MLVTCRTPWHQGYGLPGSSQKYTAGPACYDALEMNDRAVKLLGEPTLKIVAHELTESVRRNITIVRRSPALSMQCSQGTRGTLWVVGSMPEARRTILDEQDR
jgi:hypothetical protein